jgi:predicted phage terminase large subunit-like protein
VKDRKLYLLHVFRDKLEFPDLKRAVRLQADIHKARFVLIEDKASGTSLIQQLQADHFTIVQAAPNLEGDKIMRLRAETPKIEGGFVLFPKTAPWLSEYLSELLSFPNGKYADQVDATVYALAWMTMNPRWSGWSQESVQGLENLISRMTFHQFLRSNT